MPRLTISLPKVMHNHLSSLSVRQNESLSKIINELLQVGLQNREEERLLSTNPVEQHCQQLIIQMSVLIKSMSAEILKFNPGDFEQLRAAAIVKFNELLFENGRSKNVGAKNRQ